MMVSMIVAVIMIVFVVMMPMIVVVMMMVVSMVMVVVMMVPRLRSALRIEVFVGFPRVFETGIALAGAQSRQGEEYGSQYDAQRHLLVELELAALEISHLFGHFVLVSVTRGTMAKVL